jgi:hypothetical protein
MSEHEEQLVQLRDVLSKIARPHGVDEALPSEVRTSLWQLGFSCHDLTPRQELIAQLWARKRSLQMMVMPSWGGPGMTPPTAA